MTLKKGITRVYLDDNDERPIRPRVDISKRYNQRYPETDLYVQHLKSAWSLIYFNHLMTISSSGNIVDTSIKASGRYLNSLVVTQPSMRTLRQCVSELLKVRLLIKLESGDIMINPIPFWAGEIEDRRMVVKNLTIGGHNLNPPHIRDDNKIIEEAEKYIEQGATELEGSFDGTSNI